MNGPEHIEVSEGFLARVAGVIESDEQIDDAMAEAIRGGLMAAQAHAMLAQAIAAERVAKALENLSKHEGALEVYAWGPR